MPKNRKFITWSFFGSVSVGAAAFLAKKDRRSGVPRRRLFHLFLYLLAGNQIDLVGVDGLQLAVLVVVIYIPSGRPVVAVGEFLYIHHIGLLQAVCIEVAGQHFVV